MDEVEQQGVEELATPDSSQQHDEDASSYDTSERRETEESAQDRNWRAMREKQSELERREQEASQRAKMMEEINLQILAQMKNLQGQPIGQPIQEEEEELPADDYVPWGKTKSYLEKRTSKERDAIKKEVLAEVERNRWKERLSAKYADFDDVVNVETLALLEKNDPELGATIAELKDPYKIGLQSYKYIKSLGLHEKVSPARRAIEVEKKLEKNSKSVQSPQAFDKRPMAQAFRLTEADKKQLYKEMMGYASQAGYGY